MSVLPTVNSSMFSGFAEFGPIEGGVPFATNSDGENADVESSSLIVRGVALGNT